jgi:hypothetical protein
MYHAAEIAAPLVLSVDEQVRLNAATLGLRFSP